MSAPDLSSVTASESVVNATNTTEWATEWLGYLALGMFSMVLLIPTLGIVGLMVWEYFSDEADRKAERQKEIEQIMTERFLGKPLIRDDEEEAELTVRHRTTKARSDEQDFDCI